MPLVCSDDVLLTVLARVCAANDRYRFRCTCYGERIGVAYRLLVWLLEYETNKVQSASSRKEIIFVTITRIHTLRFN